MLHFGRNPEIVFGDRRYESSPKKSGFQKYQNSTYLCRITDILDLKSYLGARAANNIAAVVYTALPLFSASELQDEAVMLGDDR